MQAKQTQQSTAALLQKMREADAEISRLESDLSKAKAAREVLQQQFDAQQKQAD